MMQIMLEQIIERLMALAVDSRQLPEGAYLFHRGDTVRAIFVVEAGRLELVRRQRNGAAIVLQRGGAGTVLAEASIYSDRYHCDALAAVASSLLVVPKSAFLGALRADAVFADLWAAHLAHAVQSARTRAEILSLRTVAERLDGWLAWRTGVVPAKGAWKSIAAEIGVSPEALYREMAKRRS
jgi:CRP-like cAMP-binding protein